MDPHSPTASACGRIPVDDALLIARQIAVAIEAAHEGESSIGI